MSKRLFRLADAVPNRDGVLVAFGLSHGISDDTVTAKVDSGEWVEIAEAVDTETGPDKPVRRRRAG